MARPRRPADRPAFFVTAPVSGEPIRPARLLLGVGFAYGIVGGLLGALDVVGVALAIALNQQAIIRYTAEYTTYQQCLRQNPAPALCQAPTSGVLTVSVIWLLFLGAGLLSFILAQVAYAAAARAVAGRTGSRSAGVSAAMFAAGVGWLLYLVASVGAVFAQASPLTMTAPPPGVETAALHLGTAIGNALFDALTLLPNVVVAMVVGAIAAQRVVRTSRRVSRGPAPKAPAAVDSARVPPSAPSLPTFWAVPSGDRRRGTTKNERDAESAPTDPHAVGV